MCIFVATGTRDTAEVGRRGGECSKNRRNVHILTTGSRNQDEKT